MKDVPLRDTAEDAKARFDDAWRACRSGDKYILYGRGRRGTYDVRGLPEESRHGGVKEK